MLFHLRFAAKQELQVFICFPSRLNCSIQLKGHISIKAIDALESRLYADDVSCSVCTHITTYITYYITHNPEIPSCFNNVIQQIITFFGYITCYTGKKCNQLKHLLHNSKNITDFGHITAGITSKKLYNRIYMPLLNLNPLLGCCIQ